MVESGTYVLVVTLPEPATVDVGALGACDLPAGGYTYTGSAFGSGGFGRIDRHRRVAAGTHDVHHWHVDYLLGQLDTSLVGTERLVDEDAECSVARDLADVAVGADAADAVPIPGFGASDCDCAAHLSRFADREAASEQAAAVAARYR